jgi:mono/diheme cytochrome c family protein
LYEERIKMKKSVFLLVVVLVLSALVLAACSSQPAGGSSPSTRQTPPAAYASKTNPVKGNADAAAKGKVDYANLCQTCHGDKGLGDGPAGVALDPKPANLAKAATEASDAYIFWRVSEGGSMAPFNSSMPAHKDTLSEDKIWQIITYIQTSFK